MLMKPSEWRTIYYNMQTGQITIIKIMNAQIIDYNYGSGLLADVQESHWDFVNI